MTKWEYEFKYLVEPLLSMDIVEYNSETLNHMGQQGWELVSVDNWIAYFKRPYKNLEINFTSNVHINPHED